MGFKQINLLKDVEVDDYLATAKQVARFIKNNEIITLDGKYWRTSGNGINSTDKVDSILDDRSLYSGAAGIGYFLIQLYQVTHEEEYLNDAKETARYLINTYNRDVAKKPGIHSGASGEGLFLYKLYEITKDITYKRHALVIADDVYDSAIKENGVIHWNGLFDYMGDAGVSEYWLYIYEQTGEKKYLEYAGEVIKVYVNTAIAREDGSVFWNLFDPSGYFTELPKGGIVPNFAHGTAGVIYLLTKYYEVTRESKYLDYAKKGTKFLRSIEVMEEDAEIVPYLYFDTDKKAYDTYYLGYCHGPVGDAITAKTLYTATNEKEYLDFYNGLSHGLIKSGVPYKKSAGYWNDCLCCGSAGIIIHFLDAYRLTNNKEYLDLAKKTANKSVNDAYKDEKGCRWYNAWTRVKPWGVDSHLGLFVGAAGSASVLLSLYAELNNIRITELFNYEKNGYK